MMEAVTIHVKEKIESERIVVVGERRRSSAPHCSVCGSRRKTWLDRLGWVCTVCFDRCKETAEQLVDAGSGVSRMRQAYDLAIRSYQVAYGVLPGKS
jgi:transposase-like protein